MFFVRTLQLLVIAFQRTEPLNATESFMQRVLKSGTIKEAHVRLNNLWPAYLWPASYWWSIEFPIFLFY